MGMTRDFIEPTPEQARQARLDEWAGLAMTVFQVPDFHTPSHIASEAWTMAFAMEAERERRLKGQTDAER